MKGKVAQSFPFSWNLKLSKAPPKKACTDFELSPEQLAITECTYGECPKAHLQFDPCVIVNQCARLETSDFYIIKCAKDTSTTFMLLRRSAITLKVTVQWWAPSTISKSKAGKYHNNACEAQTTKHRIQNRQQGAPQCRFILFSTTQFTLGFQR